MLSGRRAFEGASQASLIAAILTAQPPPLSNLPEGPLERMLRTCLAKDPDDRWQSAADLARELRWIADARPLEPSQMARTATGLSARVSWIVAAIAVVAAVFFAWLYFRQPAAEQRSIRFTIATPARLPLQVRISPDGAKLAFIGQNAEGKPVLWLRPLDKLQAQVLPGTENAMYPFWSPDSRQIAFFGEHDGKLQRIDLAGAQPQIVCDAAMGTGGDWCVDGAILFAPDMSSGIQRVSAGGGVPVQVTKPGKPGAAILFLPSCPTASTFCTSSGPISCKRKIARVPFGWPRSTAKKRNNSSRLPTPPCSRSARTRPRKRLPTYCLCATAFCWLRKSILETFRFAAKPCAWRTRSPPTYLTISPISRFPPTGLWR
jgi:hypothetical protein